MRPPDDKKPDFDEFSGDSGASLTPVKTTPRRSGVGRWVAIGALVLIIITAVVSTQVGYRQDPTAWFRSAQTEASKEVNASPSTAPTPPSIDPKEVEALKKGIVERDQRIANQQQEIAAKTRLAQEQRERAEKLQDQLKQRPAPAPAAPTQRPASSPVVRVPQPPPKPTLKRGQWLLDILARAGCSSDWLWEAMRINGITEHGLTGLSSGYEVKAPAGCTSAAPAEVASRSRMILRKYTR